MLRSNRTPHTNPQWSPFSEHKLSSSHMGSYRDVAYVWTSRLLSYFASHKIACQNETMVVCEGASTSVGESHFLWLWSLRWSPQMSWMWLSPFCWLHIRRKAREKEIEKKQSRKQSQTIFYVNQTDIKIEGLRPLPIL